jgi:hypothetical protein
MFVVTPVTLVFSDQLECFVRRQVSGINGPW